MLGSRPELKEELPGLLSIYDISVRKDGKALEIKDNPMTVKIPMNDHLKGYKYYQAVYLGDPLERFDAVVEGDFLVFETTHLSHKPSEKTESPQTGDNSNMFLLVALLFASGGVLTVLGVTDKRKKKGITK